MIAASKVRKIMASAYQRCDVLREIPTADHVARSVDLALWWVSGRPVPPPSLFKARTVRKYARQYGLRCLVETGTYRGGMIGALKGDFDEIYSIELSEELHSAARRRFVKDKHIELICGDSGEELPRLMGRLASRALFWLDAHYSGGETAGGSSELPIMKEIACVLEDRRTHVVLVDDMRLFGADPGYPTSRALIARISEMVGERLRLEIRDDILRITPQLAGRLRDGCARAGPGHRVRAFRERVDRCRRGSVQSRAGGTF